MLEYAATGLPPAYLPKDDSATVRNLPPEGVPAPLDDPRDDLQEDTV